MFWLEEAADKSLKPAAVLWMCQERLGALSADANGVRSAAGRSWGERVQESERKLCRCLIFCGISLFVLEILFALFVCGPLCLLLENNEIVV